MFTTVFCLRLCKQKMDFTPTIQGLNLLLVKIGVSKKILLDLLLDE